MTNKAMWDWMDKAEGRKDSSHKNMEKEKVRQGRKPESLKLKKEAMAAKMDKKRSPDYNEGEHMMEKKVGRGSDNRS